MPARLRAPRLARLVLAWFALVLGVGVLSPLVHPQGLQLVCSAAGAVQLVAAGDDASAAQPGHTLDCPLCAHLAAPPPPRSATPATQPLARAVQPIPAARIAGILAAALPARGPPPSLLPT